MRHRLFRMGISDIYRVVRVPVLLIACIFPLVITLVLTMASRYLSDANVSDNELILLKYYSIIAVSLISAIPFIYGIVFSLIRMKRNLFGTSGETETTTSGAFNIYLLRMAESALFSFIVVLPSVFLSDAVPTEGWLRKIYVSLLLSATAPFIYSFSTALMSQGWKFMPGLSVSLIFLLITPTGLLLHHPWNYLAFFSPFYWINWAWIISMPGESLIYGTISLLIMAAGVFIFYRLSSRGTIPV